MSTYVYVLALHDSKLVKSSEGLIAALVALGGMYHGVLSAIEDAETTLADDN